MTIEIRPASPADTEKMVAIHFAAVHELAADCYPPEILDAWSSTPGEERYTRLRQWVVSIDECFIVAEDEGAMVGFGSVAAAVGHIRAVYVHPGAAGRGVGAAILARLESLAAERGVDCIRVNASLNAEGFYLKCGYEIESRGFFRLHGGAEMACLKMRKKLK